MKLGGFANLRNTDRGDIPYFSVTEKDGILREPTRQREYKKYRAQYKKVRGVFPELDKLNNPPVAVCADDAFWPEDAQSGNAAGMRREVGHAMKEAAWGGANLMGGPISEALGGMIGALGGALGAAARHNPEHVAAFLSKFSVIVEDQKYVYSLASSADFIPDLDNLDSGDHIVNDLGYRYDAENGVYLEGTFQNGELVYGMMFDGEMALFGDVRDGSISEGILRTSSTLDCGVFNDEGLNCENGFRYLTVTNDDGETVAIVVIGKYIDGDPEGTCYVHEIQGGATYKQNYVGGVPEEKSLFAEMRDMQKESKKKFKQDIKEKGLIGAYVDNQKKAAKTVLDVFNPFAGKKKR